MHALSPHTLSYVRVDIKLTVHNPYDVFQKVWDQGGGGGLKETKYNTKIKQNS